MSFYVFHSLILSLYAMVLRTALSPYFFPSDEKYVSTYFSVCTPQGWFFGGFSYLVMQCILFIFTIYSSNVQFVSIQINLILLFIFLIKVLC